MDKNKFCGFCGALHVATSYPRKCEACGMETFINPIPVAVLLVPVMVFDKVGLLIGKRGIAPHIGDWALIGGFVDIDDRTIEHAAVREMREETKIDIPVEDVYVRSSYNNGTNMMVFCEVRKTLQFSELFDIFELTNECTGLSAILEPEQLCFPSHTKAVVDWFNK